MRSTEGVSRRITVISSQTEINHRLKHEKEDEKRARRISKH